MHGYKFNSKNAYEALTWQLEWEKERLPPKLTSIGERFIQEGIIYLFGRDKAFRPFIHVNASRLVELDPENSLGLPKEEIC